jgi:hypothetical protein
VICVIVSVAVASAKQFDDRDVMAGSESGTATEIFCVGPKSEESDPKVRERSGGARRDYGAYQSRA